ncbi:unnamed protein product, partial [Darwinula stevensoni]
MGVSFPEGPRQGEVWVKRKEPPGGLSLLSATNPMDITYSGVHYWVRDGRRGMKEILKGLDGRIKPGELTAIMGPSGAGKSSLMNVLAGYRVKGVTGKVEVNGRERDLRVFRHLSTYIPQQDHVIPTLTVMESMLVAASLKLPSSVSHKDKLTAVEEILKHLGIQHCAETKAWHLSGGQRKRLCIAMELVNNPPVLFLDEPTSGLDSSTCLQCVSLLRMLAHEGRTVICTIHHPSAKILEMFDHLILLTEGLCLYHGTISSMVPYLRRFGLDCPPYHNPADFVMEVAVGDNGREAMNALFAAAKAEATMPPELEGPALQTPLRLEGEPPPSAAASGGKPPGAWASHPCGMSLTQWWQQHRGMRKGSPLPSALPSHEFSHLVVESGGVSRYHGCHPCPLCFTIPSKAISKSKIEKIPFLGSLLRNLESGSPTGLWTRLKGSVGRTETKPQPADAAVAEYAVSFAMQVKCLYLRFNKTNSRDRILMHIRLGAHILVALFLGTLFSNLGDSANNVFRNVGSLFFSILFVVYGSMMPTVITSIGIPRAAERDAEQVVLPEGIPRGQDALRHPLRRERPRPPPSPFRALHPLIPSVMCPQALCTFVYLVICYFMTAQPMDADRFLRYLALSVYVALVAQTLGFMIGTIFPIQVMRISLKEDVDELFYQAQAGLTTKKHRLSAESCINGPMSIGEGSRFRFSIVTTFSTLQTAVFLSPVIALPFVLFSGFLLSVKSIPGYLRWLSHLSFLKYYFEGTMSCIYGFNRPDLQCNEPYCHFKDPDRFLREMGLEEYVYWRDFWVLLLYNVILRLLAYFVLRWRLHRAR